MTAFEKKQASGKSPAEPRSSKRIGRRDERRPNAVVRSAGKQPSVGRAGVGAAREKLSDGANAMDTGERGTTGPAAI